jgi:osmotically inducible protein OsmC
MQLLHLLAEHGKPVGRIGTTAQVCVEPDAGGGFSIRSSALALVAEVPGIGVEEFDRLADQAKTGWPVSKALGTIELSLSARLV